MFVQVALNFGGGQGSVSAWTQPNLSGDGTIASVVIDNNLVLRPTAFSIGIGHVWYSVAPGTVIDPAFAATAPAFANAFTGDLSGQIQLSLLIKLFSLAFGLMRMRCIHGRAINSARPVLQAPNLGLSTLRGGVEDLG